MPLGHTTPAVQPGKKTINYKRNFHKNRLQSLETELLTHSVDSGVRGGFFFQVTKPARGVPRVFVNRTRPGSTGFVGWVMGLGRSVKFDEPDDLILLGDCDQQVRLTIYSTLVRFDCLT